MPTAVRELLGDPSAQLLSLSVDQYHRMIRAGILVEGEPYELLNGLLVQKERHAEGADPMTVSDEHAFSVDALNELNSRLRRSGSYLRVQQPITLPPNNEPEPDGAIVVGPKERYRGRKPGPEDILCVIEVAAASLVRDRTTKLRVYADAGIPLYLIVNLVDRAIEAYSRPLRGKGRYADSATFTGRQTVALPAGGGKEIRVPSKKLLP